MAYNKKGRRLGFRVVCLLLCDVAGCKNKGREYRTYERHSQGEYIMKKVLNLYAGIGGNRKLWGNDYEITAVEIDPKIANIYRDNFPNDNVVVGDAHKYLVYNFKEFDFIWSSPPCPSHSKLRTMQKNVIYPDMTLYQEIILLKKWFKGKWIIENVIPYYDPLIKPNLIMHRHCIWCNFNIWNKEFEKLETCKKKGEREYLQEKFGFNLDNYDGIDKRKALRNCVVPEMGLHILECYEARTPSLFGEASNFI